MPDKSTTSLSKNEPLTATATSAVNSISTSPDDLVGMTIIRSKWYSVAAVSTLLNTQDNR